jgi:hypothetical protein
MMIVTRTGYLGLILLITSSVAVACRDEGTPARGAEFSLTLGDLHPSLDTLDFRAVGLTWLDDTTVATIDRDDQQIVALGLASGSQRRAAGRGGGPGELESAFMLLGARDGGLLVGDMSLRRVSEFDGGLEYVRSTPIPGLPIQLLSWDGDRVTAVWMDFKMTEEGTVAPEPMVGFIDLGTGATRELYSLFDPASGLSRPQTDNPFAPPFIAAAMNDAGLIYAGQSMEYRIVALDSAGTLHGSFGRPELGQVYLSEEEAAEERARMGESASRRGPPPPGMRRAVDEALEAPRPYFGPNAYCIDEADRLWVVTERTRADSTEVDVFDSAGVFLKTLALRDRVQALRFRGPRLAALVTRTAPDVEGIPGIDLYGIEE